MKKVIAICIYLVLFVLTALFLYLLIDTYRISYPSQSYYETEDFQRNLYEFSITKSLINKKITQKLSIYNYLVEVYDVDDVDVSTTQFVIPSVCLGQKDTNDVLCNCYGRVLSINDSKVYVLNYDSILFECSINDREYNKILNASNYEGYIDNTLVTMEIKSISHNFELGKYDVLFGINAASFDENLFIFSSSDFAVILENETKLCYNISKDVCNYLELGENTMPSISVIKEDGEVVKSVVSIGLIGDDGVEVNYIGISENDKIGVMIDD